MAIKGDQSTSRVEPMSSGFCIARNQKVLSEGVQLISYNNFYVWGEGGGRLMRGESSLIPVKADYHIVYYLY